ncbi:hypothetical protein AKJ08_0592 [Vulgatibacter incomptus]|uniref:Uncharacterized protein n=1 Tax=Vulgatibacter incomptus TaxID=1391653 RepID=A0A0K1P9L9_9BACT|nr:hypothetical protein AKJ08_0592 [Vulgatibacter incomptus]
MASATLLLVLLASCDSPSSTPEKAFRTFVEKVQARDVEGAWDLLSLGTQQDLTTLIEQRAKATGGAIPSDPRVAVLGSASLAHPIDDLKEIAKSDDKAALEVTSGGETRRVHMVREKGGWRVDLDVPRP